MAQPFLFVRQPQYPATFCVDITRASPVSEGVWSGGMHPARKIRPFLIRFPGRERTHSGLHLIRCVFMLSNQECECDCYYKYNIKNHKNHIPRGSIRAGNGPKIEETGRKKFVFCCNSVHYRCLIRLHRHRIFFIFSCK